MRIAALALVSALAIVACSPKAPGNTASNAAPPNPGGVIGSMFPNLFQASYRADGVITTHNGQTTPIVMIRSGQNMRMEMDSGRGHMVMIRNASNHQMYTIMNMAGRQIAMETDTAGVPDPFDAFANHVNNDPHVHVTRGGPCLQAGEAGAEWTIVRDNESGDGAPPTPHTACVAGDGVILQVKDGDRVVWQTTHVQRGPQDPAAFNLPPGVQVMNLGNAGALIAGMRGANKPASP